MASDLLSIAFSGTKAARIALDVTAQNIANASSEGYVRRSVQLAELAPSSVIGQIGDTSLAGVRLDRVVRNADLFRLAEMRRTGSDAARADNELAGLENIEAAINNAQIYPALVEFEASLEALAADPVNPSLRASVLDQAETAARAFNLATGGLDSVATGIQFDAAADVEQVNLYAQELARVNLRLARAQNGSSDQSALLDQRDFMLQRLSESADISVSFASNQTVEIRLGDAATPLVQGGTVTSFASTIAGDGTLAFTLDGSPVNLAGGSLAGQAQALTHLRDYRADLDGVAASLIATVNGVQTAGAALDGSAGQPIFAGTSAADIAAILTNPAGLATAPAGSPAGSRDPGNLDAMRAALTASDEAGQMSALLFDVSGAVSSRATTRDALSSIADSARIALQTQAGVDLDHEAVNLVRFQQAFQASGRVMQIATDLFDTILAIR